MKRGETGGRADIPLHSAYPLPHEVARIRWDCRRGMLELDLILANFLEQGLGQLTPEETAAFQGLLGCSDPDLWEKIQHGEAGLDSNTNRVLQLLRQY